MDSDSSSDGGSNWDTGGGQHRYIRRVCDWDGTARRLREGSLSRQEVSRKGRSAKMSLTQKQQKRGICSAVTRTGVHDLEELRRRSTQWVQHPGSL